MPFVSGFLLLDAPASALNNHGKPEDARTDNEVAVKKISTPQGKYPYVSAQAFRYWLRETIIEKMPDWKVSPVHREKKIAYTDADPIVYWDDDLLGYMRAPSGKPDAKKSESASPLEKDRSITRVSPFRVGTFVAVAPTGVYQDKGSMTRHDGDPVLYDHEFYRAHLRGLLSLDLTSAGTFYDGERVGFRNLDTHRRERANSDGLESATVRKQKAFRLPLEQRMQRASSLIGALAHLGGGAKQTLHYTDITPAISVLAVVPHGNNPFHRMLGADRLHRTVLHEDALKEIMSVYGDQLLSNVYVGWAKGFLDDERARLEALIEKEGWSGQMQLSHPVSSIDAFTEELRNTANGNWYA